MTAKAEKILVTGASGNVGAALFKLLRDSGRSAAAAERNPKNSESRRLDFTDSSTFKDAFIGIDSVFLMRPPAVSDVKKYVFPAIDAALASGVSHFVFLSLQGAEKNNFVPHRKVEDYLAAKNAAWTFIRPSFFMQNLTTTHREEICGSGIIYVPAGKGATNFVDARDVALAAFTALTVPGHRNKAYEITGSEALTYYRVAEIISSVTGREIKYTKPSAAAFFFRKMSEGKGFEYAAVTTAIYTASALGLAAGTTDDFQKMTGKKAVSFARFAEEHKTLWSPIR